MFMIEDLVDMLKAAGLQTDMTQIAEKKSLQIYHSHFWLYVGKDIDYMCIYPEYKRVLDAYIENML